MIDFFYILSAQSQSFIAGIFTFLITSLGAASVFLFKKINRTVMDGFLGIAAGVMIAASFFSLLNPAFDMANNLQMNSLLVVSIGFIIGAVFLYFCDKLFDYKLKKHTKCDNKRISLLIFSIIMHNIPEDCIHYVSQKRNIILVNNIKQKSPYWTFFFLLNL